MKRDLAKLWEVSTPDTRYRFEPDGEISGMVFPSDLGETVAQALVILCRLCVKETMREGRSWIVTDEPREDRKPKQQKEIPMRSVLPKDLQR